MSKQGFKTIDLNTYKMYVLRCSTCLFICKGIVGNKYSVRITNHNFAIFRWNQTNQSRTLVVKADQTINCGNTHVHLDVNYYKTILTFNTPIERDTNV